MSLRLRLLIATGIAVLCGLVVVDASTYLLVARSQRSQVDAALQLASGPTGQIAASNDPEIWTVIPEIAPGLFVAIVDSEGNAVFTAPAREAGEDPIIVDIATIDLGQHRQTVQASNGEGIRLQVDQLASGSTLVVGQSLHEINETRNRLLLALLTASAGAMVTVLAVAWWLISVGLRPLRAVEMGAAAINDQALGEQRVPGAEQQTEVGSLARALNAMLDRLDIARDEREATVAELQASEARMRQFAADASHELRTPMAATAAYAELFEKGARDRPDDLERSMLGIRTETARMAALIDELLLLARLDERRSLAIETVDLTEIVLTAVDTARTLQPKRDFITRVSGVVTVTGDPARLRQVVDNILGNVRTHTPAEAECEITLSVEDGEAVLTICDTGPGVSDDQLLRLRDRFYRVDDARTRTTGGSGLGLSIADAIVAAHDGTMTFNHNQPHGIAVTLRLPQRRSSAPGPTGQA